MNEAATTPVARTNLLGLTRSGLEAFVTGMGEKPFRARQLFKWMYKRAEGDFEHVLNIADTQAVACNFVAVNFKFNVVATHNAFRENTTRIRHLPNDSFDFTGDALKGGQVGSGDLDAHRRFDAGCEHVDTGFDWHRPGIA